MRLAIAFCLFLPSLAFAAPGTQLQRLVEQGLREYRIQTDVTKLTTAQASAIHLLVSSPDHSNVFPNTLRTRRELMSILRWNDATNPDLQ